MNDNRIGKIGLRSLAQRLNNLEASNVVEEPVLPTRKLSRLVKASQQIKVDMLDLQLQQLLEHFKNSIESITNIFEVVAFTIKYVEKNCTKLSLLLSTPISSNFKHQAAISLLKELDVDLDENLVTELVTFLCGVFFPHESEEEFEPPKQLERRKSISAIFRKKVHFKDTA